MDALVLPGYDPAASLAAAPASSSAASLAAVQTILSDLDSFSNRMNAVLGDTQRARRAQAEAEGRVQGLRTALDRAENDRAAAVAEANALNDKLALERRARETVEARLQALTAELEAARQQQEAMLAQYHQLARTLAEVGEAHRALGVAEAARAKAQRQVQVAYVAVAHAVEALPGMAPSKSAPGATGESEGEGATESCQAAETLPASPAAVAVPPPAPLTAERRREEPAVSVVASREMPGPRRLTEVKPLRADNDDATADEVQVSAGPFLNFASVHQFRSAMAVLPGIREIRFRGFEQAHLQLTVRYDSPVPLIERLRAIGGFRPHIQMFSPTVVHLQMDASAKAS